MFESLFTSVLNSILGKYIKDLDTSNLDIWILSGNVVLTDVELREDALAQLDLPVEVTHGYVGKITVKIPWTNPYSEPYVISVQDVYLIASPIKERKYDPEKARAAEVATKRKRLKSIEKAMKAKGQDQEDADKNEGDDSFTEKLLAQVVKNLQISVKNIHFRYEDKITCPGSAFAVGFTLQNLSAETTDEFWSPCVVDGSETTVYKLVNLDFLAVYWNTDIALADMYGAHIDWKSLMDKGVSSKSNTPADCQFILKPLSAESHVIYDQSSAISVNTPKLLIEVIQQELVLSLTQTQFHNVMDLIESFELMAVNQLYSKYQPTVSAVVDPKAWWKYAYTAICEEKIRCFSWERIKEHRRKFKEYNELFKKKLRGTDEEEWKDLLSDIQSLEDDIDIPSILIARQFSELEVPEHQRYHPQEAKNTSWWTYLGFGGTEKTLQELEEEEDAELFSNLSVAKLPPKEKEKLYKAINYSDNAAPIKYPAQYVKTRITFNLDSFSLMMCDQSNRDIAQLVTEGFAAALEQRPVENGIRFSTKVNGFKMVGVAADGEVSPPCLVHSNHLLKGVNKPLLEFTFETNPLVHAADYFVCLKVEHVEALYHHHTIDRIVSFVSSSQSNKLRELEVVAATKLNDLRIWTRAGLEYAITQHKVTYVDMDVQSPLIVIPEYGSMERDGSVLVLELGHLKVLSNLASRNGAVRQASGTELEEMFYDRCDVTLEEMQIILADKGTDWRNAQNADSSPFHILPCTQLELKLQKSISSENPDLPEFKVSSVLPSLHLKLSDEKFHQLRKFLRHLPLSFNETLLTSPPQGDDALSKTRKLSSSTLSLEEASDLQAVCRGVFVAKHDSDEGKLDPVTSSGERTSSQITEKAKFFGSLVIKQMLIEINQLDKGQDALYLSLKIDNLSAEVDVYTWYTSLKAKLGSMQLLDHQFTDIDGSTLCVLSSSADEDWITVNITKADRKGPVFDSKFNSIEQLIVTRFSCLKLTAKQEAIASWETFVLNLFQSEEDGLSRSEPRRFLATIPEGDQLDSFLWSEAAEINPSVRSSSNTVIRADLQEVSLVLSAEGSHVGEVNIKGLVVSVCVEEPQTKIKAELKNFSILNLSEGTSYPQILSLEDNNLFDCEVVMFNKQRNPTGVDLSVNLKLGRVRFVFLNYFVAHIQNFVRAIASPETTAHARDVTKGALKAQVKNIQEHGTKIGLNVVISAPRILIPCHSRSRDLLVADLGQLCIKNSITETSEGGLVDNMDIKLSSFKVSGFSPENTALSEHLVEPIVLEVTVKRRLGQAHGDKLPLVQVNAVLEELKVNVGVSDYKMLVMVLNENFMEGKEELHAEPESDISGRKEPHKMLEVTDGTEAVAEIVGEEEENVECKFVINKVTVSSPQLNNGELTPYLLLDISKFSATVVLKTWTLSAAASLGTIMLEDCIGKDVKGNPVSLMSSSRENDLISVTYTKVDPSCPDFETQYCSTEQIISVVLRKLNLNLVQSSLISLQEHALALTESSRQTSPAQKPSQTSKASGEKPESESSYDNSVSLKIGATLSEVGILLSTSKREIAQITVKGLAADISLYEGFMIVKSRQKDLSIIDLDTHTLYPKIVSVENENVFDFEFQLNNNKSSCSGSQLGLRDSPTRQDGSLSLNVGRINVVFVYRFICDMLKFVEPLTSPQSTRYIQETAQKTVVDQLEAAQTQGTCIELNVSITAPLITLPRHSRSVDMLLLDLGHLELENSFSVCVGEGDAGEDLVFDNMELVLQSMQLSRGVMDISSSAVVKRRLVEPVKLDATIRRSSQSSSAHPFIACSANLDFVKMNLGEKDYQLLITITQENLAEAEAESVTDSGDHQSHAESSPSLTQEEPMSTATQQTDATGADADSGAESPVTVWDYMVFAFQLEGANLTLYNKEKDLDPFDSQSPMYGADTALCLCEVEKSAVTIALLSDTSVQIHAQLNGCVVEDVRKENKTAFPRLVDKKTRSHASAARSPELCEVMFCRTATGEMKVDLQLQNASIYVSLPFIWPLLRFFTGSAGDAAQITAETVTCAVQTETDAPSTDRISDEAQMPPNNALPEDVAQLTSRPQASPAPQLIVTVQGVIKQPDFVLLADPLRGDSEAFIVQTELEFEYTLKNEMQTFSAALNDLQLISCQFPDVKSSAYEVLSPCTVEFKYCTLGTDGAGQDMSIEMDTMALKFFPGLLRTIRKVVTAVVGDQKAEQSTQTVEHEEFTWDLWQPKPAASNYWFRKEVQNKNKVNPKFVTKNSTGDKLTVKTKEVRIELLDEIEGAHVPSLLVKAQVNVAVSDWTAQLKLEADVAVEMSYYNEILAAWEPLLEPVMNEEETPHMWELRLQVFMAEGYHASFAPNDTDVTDASRKWTRGLDVTDARPKPWSDSHSKSRRKKGFRSLRCSGGFRRRSRKSLTCGTTSSDDDLDYGNALAQFVKASNKVFLDPEDGTKCRLIDVDAHETVDDTADGYDTVDGGAPIDAVDDYDTVDGGAPIDAVDGYDTVDGGAPIDAVDGYDAVDAGAADTQTQAQALYILIASHDVMQLSITPTTLDVLDHVTKMWTTEVGEQEPRLLRTPRPLFFLKNELGVHTSVTVSSKQKIPDCADETLTIRQRKAREPCDQPRVRGRHVMTTDESKTRKRFRIFSEPLLNSFKQRLQNIHRKRASSEPIFLTRGRSSVKVPSFEVGPPLKIRAHKSVSSSGVDPGMTDRSASSHGSGTSLARSDERVRTVLQEYVSSIPPEDSDQQHTTVSQAENSFAVQGHLASAIINMGLLTTVISKPHSNSAEPPPAQASVASIPEETKDEEEEYISVTVDGYYNVNYMHITRSGRYLYELWSRTMKESTSKRCIVIQVDTKNGHKTVIIRSALQVYNHLETAVVLSVLEQDLSSETRHKELFTVEPQSTENVPLSAAYDQDLFLRPTDSRYNRCDSPLSWKEFNEGKPSRVIQCSPTQDSGLTESFNIKVMCMSDSLDRLPSTEGPHHVIHLHPSLVLHNLLPLELVYTLQNSDEVKGTIQEGERVSLCMSPEDSRHLTVELFNYCTVNWKGELEFPNAGKRSAVLEMKSDEESPQDLTLGLFISHVNTTDVKIYSPYWLINKTSLSVEYKVSKRKQIYQQGAENTHPLLFNFTGGSSRKARLRLPGQPWSRRFSLDAVGDSGKVTCKTDKTSKRFEFVLQIQMSYTGLTKIVTLTPKYVIINTTEMDLSFCEELHKISLWFAVDKGESRPFWPDNSKAKQLYLKRTLSNLISKPVPFGFSHTTVLRMPELQALSVEVHGEMEDSVTTIVVMPYSPGVGTVRIENLCTDIPIRINQREATHFTVLSPQTSVLYTWDNPLQLRRQLLWKPYYGKSDPVLIDTDKDRFGEVRVELDDTHSPKFSDVQSTPWSCIPGRSTDDDISGTVPDEVDGLMRSVMSRTVHWLSVMDGLQRVILFTEDKELADSIHKCSDYESVKMEIIVTLDELGLSLVNGKPQEVSYITLSSSSSIWQIEKSHDYWKTLNLELSLWLEGHWKNPGMEISDDDIAEVDFVTMEMIRPFKRKLRRSFEPALWFRYACSEHFQSVYCKMHWLQIDNQLFNTVFPVVLYPAPLPPSVVERMGPKPFIEVAAIVHQIPGNNICHVKYAKALVQEMNVRIDKGFIIAATSLFSKQSDDIDEEYLFQEDMKTVSVSLKETSAVKATLQTQRVFLEYFHLSPLKINLSFSLGSEVDQDENQAFTEEMVDFFVDSIGATLTDINDAQLKMAFLERVGVFLTPENLVSQIIKHYRMQCVRQIYVLVLGLDVLGNPLALISGIGEGVKDLFYEPYQGFVIGPQEFAEGLARGVKSLLGHVVGGTAGTFSRITGSLGGALATLTFDSDFRMNRRRRMHGENRGVGKGVLEGGKSLAMGLIFGISGVVLKPIEGARSEGVKGFFEGIGKGLLGLLTRPTGGAIDMVSLTLDGIRRSAEQGGEDIVCKKRIPRFTAPALPLKPFSMIQAEGNGILKSLPRSHEFLGDVYEDHVPLIGEHSNIVVLLTNKRFLKLHQEKLWEKWKMDWACVYDDVVDLFVTTNKLFIRLRSSKTDLITQVHEVGSEDKRELETLRTKLEGALRRFRRAEPISSPMSRDNLETISA